MFTSIHLHIYTYLPRFTSVDGGDQWRIDASSTAPGKDDENETQGQSLELSRSIDEMSFHVAPKKSASAADPAEEYCKKLSRWTVVHEAVRKGHAWALGRVLEAGASAIALARGSSGGDVPPLVLAYRLMSLQCAEVLLSVGADSLEHAGAAAPGAGSLMLKEELDSVFDVDDGSAPKANLRAMLMLEAARAGKQRHEDSEGMRCACSIHYIM